MKPSIDLKLTSQEMALVITALEIAMDETEDEEISKGMYKLWNELKDEQ